jgi:hypothetical protein
MNLVNPETEANFVQEDNHTVSLFTQDAFYSLCATFSNRAAVQQNFLNLISCKYK